MINEAACPQTGITLTASDNVSYAESNPLVRLPLSPEYSRFYGANWLATLKATPPKLLALKALPKPCLAAVFKPLTDKLLRPPFNTDLPN